MADASAQPDGPRRRPAIHIGRGPEDGSVPGEAVRPTMTLAVALPKVGLAPGGPGGRIFVGDLGFPPGVHESIGIEPVRLPGFVTELTAD